MASEGVGLPSALGRRGPVPQAPQKILGCGAKPRPRCRISLCLAVQALLRRRAARRRRRDGRPQLPELLDHRHGGGQHGRGGRTAEHFFVQGDITLRYVDALSATLTASVSSTGSVDPSRAWAARTCVWSRPDCTRGGVSTLDGRGNISSSVSMHPHAKSSSEQSS